MMTITMKDREENINDNEKDVVGDVQRRIFTPNNVRLSEP